MEHERELWKCIKLEKIEAENTLFCINVDILEGSGPSTDGVVKVSLQIRIQYGSEKDKPLALGGFQYS